MDSQDPVNIFDRIDVVVVNEMLTARPIEFELDRNNSPVAPIRYETVCPACSSMIQFAIGESYISNGVRFLGCPHCGKGCRKEVPQKEVIRIAPNMEFKNKDSKKLDKKQDECPFLDPIEEKAFSL